MAKKIDPDKLNKLLEEVTADVVAVLAKSDNEESLAKVSPGEEAPGEETPAGSSAEGTAPAGAEGAPEGSPEGSPGEGPEGSEGSAGLEGADGGEGTEGADGSEGGEGGNSPEALVAEYEKLPVEELKIHAMAAHVALMHALGEGGEGGEGEQSGAPEGTPQATAPEATAPAPQMGKKEMKESAGNGGKIMKSELENRLDVLEKALKAKDVVIGSLEAKFSEAAEGLKNFVEKAGTQAMRKSIAGISFSKKPGEGEGSTKVVTLQKSEAVKKLNAITSDSEQMGKLSKSDREKISAYVLGNVEQTEISHLLK